MNKKIILGLFACIVLFLIFINTPFGKNILAQKSIHTDQISDRSKEYIKSQKDENEMWRTTDITKKGPTKTTIFDVDGCFTITIPYNIITKRKDGPCDYQINTGRPKTTIIAYFQTVHIDSVNEDPGVKLRRLRKEQYKEYSQKTSERSFVIFKKKTGVFDVNAFSLIGNKMLVINMKAYTPDDYTKDFHTILNSVQFNQEHESTQ